MWGSSSQGTKSAHQQEARGVDAGDEQRQQHRTQQCGQGRVHRTDQVLEERLRFVATVEVLHDTRCAGCINGNPGTCTNNANPSDCPT